MDHNYLLTHLHTVKHQEILTTTTHFLQILPNMSIFPSKPLILETLLLRIAISVYTVVSHIPTLMSQFVKQVLIQALYASSSDSPSFFKQIFVHLLRCHFHHFHLVLKQSMSKTAQNTSHGVNAQNRVQWTTIPSGHHTEKIELFAENFTFEIKYSPLRLYNVFDHVLELRRESNPLQEGQTLLCLAFSIDLKTVNFPSNLRI